MMLSLPTNTDDWICREDVDGTATAAFTCNGYVFCVGQLPGEDRSYHACIADKTWKKDRHSDMEDLVKIQTDASSHEKMEDGISALKASIDAFAGSNLGNAAKTESDDPEDRKAVLTGLVSALLTHECRDAVSAIVSMSKASQIIRR